MPTKLILSSFIVSIYHYKLRGRESERAMLLIETHVG